MQSVPQRDAVHARSWPLAKFCFPQGLAGTPSPSAQASPGWLVSLCPGAWLRVGRLPAVTAEGCGNLTGSYQTHLLSVPTSLWPCHLVTFLRSDLAAGFQHQCLLQGVMMMTESK